MDDPQSQPQSQQHRARNRVSDATTRRPRAVAGQRAAAKRAGLPSQRTQPIQVVEPVEPVESVDQVESVETAAPPELTEPIESVIDDELDSDTATSETETETEIGTEPREQRRRFARSRANSQTRRVRRAVITAILAVALLGALAGGAVLAVQYRDVIRTDHARTAAMAEAERAAPVIFSYDYRHLDQDFAKAEALLAGSFRDQYAKTTQTVVKPTALQYHGVVTATVARPADGSAPAVSVVSASPDQVVVLTFIDQSTTSTRVNGTQVDQNRVLLTLTHTAQGWRVTAVDAL